MMQVVEKLATPEVAGTLIVIVALLLAKSKFFTEQDFKKARDLLDMGMDAGQVAQKTRLKIDEVLDEAKSVQQPTVEGDTTRKQVQRSFRRALRGWLKF